MTETLQTGDDQNVRYVDVGSTGVSLDSFTAEEKSILERINQKVAASESLESIVDFLFESTHSISPCDRVGLAFIEDDGRRVVSHYARSLYEPLLLNKGYAEDLQRSSLSKVIEKGSPRIISDLERYLAEHPTSPSTKILVREGVRSSMTCPLVVDNRKVGLLFRSARQTNAYNDHHALLHLAVAERLAQAVEKAWRIEQLIEANRAYFELLGFVSHELKSPLSAMVMDAHVLADGYLGDVQPRQREKLESMIGKADYLFSLIREYIDLSRLEGGELVVKKRDVDFEADVIKPAIDIVAPQVAQRGCRVSVDLSPEGRGVNCDPELMKIVMVNLIGNAVKYGNEKGEIRVSVGASTDSVDVKVWNEGPGFTDADKSLLFRKFSRIPSPELYSRKGTGLGLYTTWRIINLHGGRIWANSEYGRWAEFSFSIPC